MSFSTLLIRTVGVGATALSAYEINNKSREHSSYETRENIAEDLTDLYIKHTVSGDGSEMTEKLKEGYMEWRMNDKHIPALQYIKNRFMGYVHGTLEHIVPLVLGVGAMFAHSESKLAIYKGGVPKPIAGLCAIGLALMGAGSFTKNVLGWRNEHPGGFS